jgi:hypothetical protein
LAVLLPVKTVGVVGDFRTYDYVVGLRAVTSSDGVTADFCLFEICFIGRVATRIINKVRGVNRVVYDVTTNRRGRSSGSREESLQASSTAASKATPGVPSISMRGQD